jgi:hypothetical protein
MLDSMLSSRIESHFHTVAQIELVATAHTLEGALRMLQGCSKDVTGVLQGCYKGVTRVLQGCYEGVTSVLLVCYKSVTSVVQGCTNDAY